MSTSAWPGQWLRTSLAPVASDMMFAASGLDCALRGALLEYEVMCIVCGIDRWGFGHGRLSSLSTSCGLYVLYADRVFIYPEADGPPPRPGKVLCVLQAGASQDSLAPSV